MIEDREKSEVVKNGEKASPGKNKSGGEDERKVPRKRGALREAAYLLREKMHGKIVYYTRSVHLSFTNVCAYMCPLCSFYKPPSQEAEGFVLTPEKVRAKLAPIGTKIDEVHLTGGCNPRLGLEYYINILKTVKECAPTAVLKGLTAVEVDHISNKDGITEKKVLRELAAVGLEVLAGGGAEILNDKIRKRISPLKCSSERWLEIHRLAHKLGIYSNATVLLGHIETWEHRLLHLKKLKELGESGRLLAVVPLLYRPEGNLLGRELLGVGPPDKGKGKPGEPKGKRWAPINPEEVLDFFSLCRLELTNIPHIKAYLPTLGEEIWRKTFVCGADDAGGTALWECIMPQERNGDEGTLSPEVRLRAAEERFLNTIKEEGFRPVRRDGLYRPYRPDRPERMDPTKPT